jgi:hypothetical protein
LRLPGGQGAGDTLERARRIAEELSASAESELGKEIAKLERAQGRLDADRPLICGYAPEDISPGQMRWLREHRPEAIPPEVMARLNEDGTLRPDEGA